MREDLLLLPGQRAVQLAGWVVQQNMAHVKESPFSAAQMDELKQADDCETEDDVDAKLPSAASARKRCRSASAAAPKARRKVVWSLRLIVRDYCTCVTDTCILICSLLASKSEVFIVA